MSASLSVFGAGPSAVPTCLHDPTTLCPQVFGVTGSSWPAIDADARPLRSRVGPGGLLTAAVGAGVR
jgi:hypothetical protein